MFHQKIEDIIIHDVIGCHVYYNIWQPFAKSLQPSHDEGIWGRVPTGKIFKIWTAEAGNEWQNTFN